MEIENGFVAVAHDSFIMRAAAVVVPPRMQLLKKSFHIATFGCKANQYDTQSLREALFAAGYEEKPLAEGPDFVIVNTCTVTATADAKARRLIHRLARELPRSRIVVTGCMASRDRHRIGSMPGVWLVLDNEHKPTLPGVLKEASPLCPANEGPTPWPEPGMALGDCSRPCSRRGPNGPSPVAFCGGSQDLMALAAMSLRQ